MQKIGELQKYVGFEENQKPVFQHPEGMEEQSRLIKMRMLSEQSVNIFVEGLDPDPETGELPPVRFLTQVPPGLEQIEFYYLGAFALLFVGGNVWLDTFDNTAFNVESVDAVSFARLMEREERDPRILEIERAARHNKLLLEQQMEADRAAFRAEMAAYREEVRANVAASTSASSAPSGSATAQGSGASSASDNGASGSTPPANGGEPQSNA